MTTEKFNAKVTVSFKTPISGIDQTTGDGFISTRHVVLASSVSQDLDLTTFIGNNGEVVAEWPTNQVEKLEWSRLEPEFHVGSLAWRQKMQSKYPMAYQPWTAEEDDSLRTDALEGLTIAQMISAHERSRGAICSRLRKLGLRD